MSDSALQTWLATRPDGTLEAIASQYHTTLLNVVQLFPGSVLATGGQFDTVWETIRQWGPITLLVNTGDVILEFRGELPPGSHRRGYFNLEETRGLSGHIRSDNCAHIGFIERKFMGMDSAAVIFFNAAGSAMLKIFVARDEHRKLLPAQLDAFRQLASQASEA